MFVSMQNSFHKPTIYGGRESRPYSGDHRKQQQKALLKKCLTAMNYRRCNAIMSTPGALKHTANTDRPIEDHK